VQQYHQFNGRAKNNGWRKVLAFALLPSKAMQAKLKEITGILKEKRRGYEQARKLPVTAVPQFGQIKVGRIAFLNARAGPKTARDALQTLLGELFGNGQRSNAPRHCLHFAIESVDFDDLRIKTGLQLKVTLVRSNQTDVDSPHRWYAVEASIADANLPLGAALKQHQEAIEAQAQDLQVKTSLGTNALQQRRLQAEAAYERIKVAIVTELPDLLAGGVESIELPEVRFQDTQRIERSFITAKSIE
jgi:hypothetical protein